MWDHIEDSRARILGLTILFFWNFWQTTSFRHPVFFSLSILVVVFSVLASGRQPVSRVLGEEQQRIPIASGIHQSIRLLDPNVGIHRYTSRGPDFGDTLTVGLHQGIGVESKSLLQDGKRLPLPDGRKRPRRGDRPVREVRASGDPRYEETSE